MSKKINFRTLRSSRPKNAQRPPALKSSQARGVLLAIKNEILREGLRSMIFECGFRVNLLQGSLQEFVADARSMQRSQIVVIDGSEERDADDIRAAVDRIRHFDEHVHIIILVPPHFEGVFDRSVAASASAIVTTDITAHLLINLLQLVSGNYIIRSNGFALDMEPSASQEKDEVKGRPAKESEIITENFVVDKMFMELSGREKQILVYVARGASNKIIARALGISEATVKIHVKGIFRKIGVSNRTQAAFHVFRRGWLMDEQSLPQPGVADIPQVPNCVPVNNAIVLGHATAR